MVKWLILNSGAVRVSSKFQPKAKPRPRNETSASLPITLPHVTKEKPVTLASSTDAVQSIRPVNIVGGRLADSVCPSSSTGMLRPKEPLLEYEGSFSRVPLGNDDRSSVIVKPSAPLDAIDVLHSEVAIADGNGDWSSSHGKSFGEVKFVLFSGYFCDATTSMINFVIFRMQTYFLGWNILMIFSPGLPL